MQSWDGHRPERPLLADGAGMIAVLLLIFAVLHMPGVDVAAASTALNLYQARTIVTGQREETRGPGLERCLEDVLVKVSGDPLVLADPAIASMKGHAASYVTRFRYRDRMEGIPIHDEQGSRDRPYDLTVDFQANQIDAALRPSVASRGQRRDRASLSFSVFASGRRLICWPGMAIMGSISVTRSPLRRGKWDCRSNCRLTWIWALPG
jgi:hypothetical protein